MSQNSDVGDFYGPQSQQCYSNDNDKGKQSITAMKMNKKFYSNSSSKSNSSNDNDNDNDTSIIPLQPVDMNISFDLPFISRQLYPETPYNKDNNNKDNNNNNNSSLLQAARDDDITISDEARRKSLSIFQETPTSVVAMTSTNKPSLLQTARGGQVVISEEARRKSLSIFQETPTSVVAMTSTNKPSLLQTARGGQVVISEEARRKSLSILQDTTHTMNTNTNTNISTNTNTNTNTETIMKPSLLQTARGGKVTISEDARRKSLSILQETPTSNTLSNNTMTNPYSVANSSSSMNPSLLQTARGSKVTISEEARRKSLSVLEGNTSLATTTPKPPTALARRNTISSNINLPLVTPSSIRPNLPKANNTSLKRSSSLSAKFVTPATKSIKFQQPLSSNHLNQTDDSHPFDINVNIDRGSLIEQSEQFVDRYVEIKQAEHERLKFVMTINSYNAQNIDIDDNGKLYMLEDNKSLLLRKACDQISKYTPFSFTVVPINEDRYKWLGMQLRWIVWTLASHERKSPSQYLGSLLTADNVFKLLNHRYTMYTGCYRNISTDVKTAPNLGFVMEKGDLLNFLLKSKAVKHFNRTGSQSSLQRCADIGVLLNPMVLCFSNHGSNCEVTDGWWWIKVVLDADLSNLVEKKLLCDGVKIAILSAAFELEGSSFSMKLFYNGVKKARSDAPLGFIKSQNITGLSLQAASPNGGNVALAHVKLISICSPMAKVQKQYGDTNDFVDKRSSSLKHLIMDTSELIEYRKFTEKRREAVAKEVENDEDLRLENLLEDVCSDETIIAIIKNSAAGYDVHMEDEDQQREVSRIITKVRQLQQDTASKLMSRRLAELNSDESVFVDALVRDIRSQTLAWIRCMIQRNDTEKITDTMSIFSSFPIGSVIAISNVNKMRPSLCSTPLFVLRSNSACRLEPMTSSTCNLGLGLSSIQLEPIECLRQTMETPWGNYSSAKCATKPGSEITLSCTVTSWRKIYENDEPYIEITTLDKSRVTVIILYPYDNNSNVDNAVSNITTNCGIRWLNKCENIVVSLGLIKDVDYNYDIIRMLRHDRTVIKSVSTTVNNNMYNEIYEDEIKRYAALCENKVTFRSFNNVDIDGTEYYCKRLHCYNARMLIDTSTTTAIENIKAVPIKVTDGAYNYEMLLDLTSTPLLILTAMGITYDSNNSETSTIGLPKYNEVFDIVYMQGVNATNDKSNLKVVYLTLVSSDDYLKRIRETKKFI